MFIKASVFTNHSISESLASMGAHEHDWFPHLKDKEHDGHHPRATVGFSIAGVPVRKEVEVTWGSPLRIGDWLRVPISWVPTHIDSLFPSFDGTLELSPLDEAHTKVSVSGIYEPPFGSVGQQIDHAMMHSVAEATLKDLVHEVAEAIDSDGGAKPS